MDEFEEIYQRYFTDVYRYILKLSGSRMTAEDITAETFFKAMQALGSFRRTCSMRVWLCQIGKNLYFNQLRAQKRVLPQEGAELLKKQFTEKTPEEALIEKAEVSEINNILLGLREPYKEVFMLRVYAELSFEEIGSLYEKSQNWACVTYHRARTMIKNQLEEKSDEK